MNNEVIKVLRLVEKGLISKEQGYILIKAHYENAGSVAEFEGMDLGLMAGEAELAIESSAELIDELIDAARGTAEDWSEIDAYSRAVDGFVREIIDAGASTGAEDDCDEAVDDNNFVKKDYYLAGEKVYEQRNVSLKSIRRGKKYKANFLVHEIQDSQGACIEDKHARSAALQLIDERFCGRFRKIKNSNIVKIFIE